MGAADLLDDSFPHGTPGGFDAGCRGGACPAVMKCRDVRARYMGDYSFRKQIDAGLTVAEILSAEAAAVVVARHETAAARRAERVAALATTPIQVRVQSMARQPKPKVTRQQPAARASAVGAIRREKNIRVVPIPGHGSLTMCRRGCRGADCPAEPSCAAVASQFFTHRNQSMNRTVQGHGTNACYARGCRELQCVEAHKAYYRDYSRRRRGTITAEQHGTAYGYVLGCRDKDACPSSPSCTAVQRAAEKANRRAHGVPAAPELVDALPVIAHIRDLEARGVTLREIGRRAGVGKTMVYTLIKGRQSGDRRGQVPARIAAERAERILAVTA